MAENDYGSPESNSRSSKQFQNGSESSKTTSGSGRPPVHEETVHGYMEGVLKSQGRVATFNEAVQATGLPESTVSRLRSSWLQQSHKPADQKEFHVKQKEDNVNPEVIKWNNAIKVGLKLGAYFLWFCSIVFSLFGLIGVLSEREAIKGWMWWFFFGISLGLSAIVTLLELALNREDLNTMFHNWKVRDLVLWIFGACSYAYDIYTNIAGISLFVLGTANIFHIPLTNLLIPAFFGLAIAIGPEPMLMKSIEMKYERNSGNSQQQKQRIPIPPPNSVKQIDTVSPRFDPAMLARLQKTQPYRPMSSKR